MDTSNDTVTMVRTVDLQPGDVTTTLERRHGRRTVARVYPNGERGIVGNRPLYNVEFTDGTGNSGKRPVGVADRHARAVVTSALVRVGAQNSATARSRRAEGSVLAMLPPEVLGALSDDLVATVARPDTLDWCIALAEMTRRDRAQDAAHELSDVPAWQHYGRTKTAALQAIEAEFGVWLESELLRASEACKGLLVKDGAPASERSLWTEAEWLARKYATEELNRYWDENGRRSRAHFLAEAGLADAPATNVEPWDADASRREPRRRVPDVPRGGDTLRNAWNARDRAKAKMTKLGGEVVAS